MKLVTLEETWPLSWKESYLYDQEEIYGKIIHYGYAYAYRQRQRRTLEAISRVAQPGAAILDVAAAQGNFSLLLAERGYDVTWNDLRADLAGYVSLKHEKGALHYAPGNVFDLGFNAEFDVVLITEVIEHVAHPDEFLKKVKRLVKPGGCIVMTTPNGAYFLNRLPKFSECSDPSQFESAQFKPNSDGHIFLLYAEEIEALARAAGLIVEETQFFVNFLTRGRIKTELLLKFLPRRVVNGIETCTAAAGGRLFCKLNMQILTVLRSV